MSFDETIDDTHNYYFKEFLNLLLPNNVPPHKLILKKHYPFTLLRNIAHPMVHLEFRQSVIYAETTKWQHVET